MLPINPIKYLFPPHLPSCLHGGGLLASRERGLGVGESLRQGLPEALEPRPGCFGAETDLLRGQLWISALQPPRLGGGVLGAI